MGKRKFGIYLFSIFILLTGLLWVQYFWVSYSFRLKNDEFKHKVQRHLELAAVELEDRYFCFNLLTDLSLSPDEGFYIIRHQGDGKGGFAPVNPENPEEIIDTVEATFTMTEPVDTTIGYKQFIFEAPINARISLDFEFDYERTKSIPEGNLKDFILESYRNSITDKKSLFRIVDTVTLDSIMVKHLSPVTGGNDLEYALIDEQNDSLVWSSRKVLHAGLFDSPLKTVLYDRPNFDRTYRLQLFIPDANVILMKSLWFVLASSIIVFILVAFLLLFFLRNAYNQRRINEMKSDFISNMTHEFNTPVSNINLALDTIDRLNGNLKEELPELLGIIREENKRLENNIGLLLETDTLQKAKIKLNPEKLHLNEIIEKVISSYDLRMKSAGGKIEVISELQEDIVNADEVHLVNVMYNLFDNAVKYNNQFPQIQVRLKKKEKYRVIEVTDNGIGIKETQINKIFEPFYRIHTGKVHDVKGFGLGLHYVKNVAEAHEGFVEVQSTFGKGSTFSIFLPEDVYYG